MLLQFCQCQRQCPIFLPWWKGVKYPDTCLFYWKLNHLTCLLNKVNKQRGNTTGPWEIPIMITWINCICNYAWVHTFYQTCTKFLRRITLYQEFVYFAISRIALPDKKDKTGTKKRYLNTRFPEMTSLFEHESFRSVAFLVVVPKYMCSNSLFLRGRLEFKGSEQLGSFFTPLCLSLTIYLPHTTRYSACCDGIYRISIWRISGDWRGDGTRLEKRQKNWRNEYWDKKYSINFIWSKHITEKKNKQVKKHHLLNKKLKDFRKELNLTYLVKKK